MWGKVFSLVVFVVAFTFVWSSGAEAEKVKATRPTIPERPQATIADEGMSRPDEAALGGGLPDDWLLLACPQAIQPQVADLELQILGFENFDPFGDPGTQLPTYYADFDGDGILDPALLLKHSDPGNPKTVVFEAVSTLGEIFPPDVISFGSPFNRWMAGHEFDEHMNDIPGFPQAAAATILQASFKAPPPDEDPIFSQIYLAGNNPPGPSPLPNAPLFGPPDFLGIPAQFSTQFNDPGVYVFAASFSTTDGLFHCTEQFFRVLICPVSSHCDEEGNPLAPGPDGNVTICHVPPGNPARVRTISVSPRALPAHMAHGDYCGECESSPLRSDRGAPKRPGGAFEELE